MRNRMINELSILIPVYNDNATVLVRVLQAQAEAVDGLEYEILAVDDGPTLFDTRLTARPTRP